jgi:murein DD-endopeptidase MepM/ murein hydrolase activator NlpD
VIKNNAVKHEEERLLNTYHDIRSHLLRFEKLTNNIEDIMDDLKPEIEELYELAAGSDTPGEIWNMEDFDQKDMEELKKMKNILPDEVFELKDVQKNMICTTNTIKTIKNFIDVRSKVVKDTPSIISKPGHITSLFGWRRSPFGHGRDFHTGIDIAAPSGTPIIATAPGLSVRRAGAGDTET